MKKILILLAFIPIITFGQVNTFPWTHNFDNGVGLTNWTGDDGDWLTWSGYTWSNNTGPQGDHTTGSGNYWYVEASSPNYPDMYFVSQTDTFDISQTPGQILSFWYHMYGNTMGELNIWIGDNNGWLKIDATNGDQGDQWHLKYIDLDSLGIIGNFTIAFEGITGSSWASDIAIDDLYIGDPYSIGCVDTAALNYDPLAAVDDGSCTYPPCGGFVNSHAYQMCWGSQAAIQFEWESDTSLSQCDVVVVHAGDENGWSVFFPGYWPASNGLNGHAVGVGNGQMPPNWSLEHYCVLEYTDGTFSDTIFYTPDPCITGCMDSTQEAYNPFATIDDGSCSGTTCDPATEQQITMTIKLDNWPGETGWTMVTNSGAGISTPSGTYNYNDIGQTYTYSFCVSSTAGFEFILTDTYGDGIMGNGTPGSAGEVVIYDCNGDTITYLSSGDWLNGQQQNVGVSFGNVAYSTPQNGTACAGPPAVLGCMDASYQEFNPLANINDSSCVNLHVYGCMDSTMFNYSPSASQVDLVPVCDYTLIIKDDAADGWGNSYLGVTQGTNTWTFTMGPGSYSQLFPLNLDTDKPITVYYFQIQGGQQSTQAMEFQTMQNSFILKNAYGDTLLAEGTNPFSNNGQGALQGFSSPFWATYSAVPYCGDYCEPVVTGCLDSIAYNYNNLANTSDTCYYQPGCTSPGYLEYYTQGYLADINDGSCQTLTIFGCTDSLAFNYDPNANLDNGGCIPVIFGCMNDLAFNYNPNANTADTCIAVIYGCMSSIAINYNPLANTDDGSCIGVTYGCTDTTMWNYSPSANVDDGSCIPYIYGCMDATMWNYDPLANTDNGACIAFVYGCTDSTMFNYDLLANTDNNSCVPYIYGCTNPIALNYCDSCNTDDFSCILPIYGCTDSTMFNYNPLANVDNNSCASYIYGCTDPSMLNYNPDANTEDFTCVAYAYGCMDNTALNYDSTANTDNGSCIEIITGCMDQDAWNYDILANVHDTISCLYDAGCVTGPGNPYWLNDPCYEWVILVDEYCCENEWDTICQATYNHCEGTWIGPLPKRFNKELIMVADILGRPAKPGSNQILFFIYNDGTVEKKLTK
tara:strand:- start:1210 stop:4470 length:3261 start_codon:yes stop_codon:yes gene_type:complete